MKSPQRDDWYKAMEEEMNVIKDRKVWQLVKPLEGINPLGCRWVYTIKKDQNGKIAWYKARFVAQGR